MAVGLLGSVPASAVHDEGFALQGNIDHSTLIDWVDLFDVTGPESGTTTTPKATLPGDVTAAAFEDDYPLPDPSGYATGSKDTLPISTGWECKTPNNLGDKFDLLNAYAAALVPSSNSEQGDLTVNFGSEISSPLGNRNAGLWLLQDDNVACEGEGNTSFGGEHVDGDVFIVSAFTNGGAQANIDVYEWVDPNPDDAVEAGSLQLKAGFTNALCPPTGQDTACAIANTDGDKQADEAQFAIDPPWTAPDKDGGNLNEAEFFEGAVNLSDLGLEGCFTRFLANSRSSQETTSTLHDFAFGDFDICDANISITGDGVNEVGEQHTFTVEAESIFGGQSSPPPDGTEVDVDLVSSNGATLDIVSNSCATDGLVGGTCTVVFTSSTTGIVTASATADIPVGGETIPVSTSGQHGQGPDVLKRFVDADVSIAADAVNEVGDQHTWTVTATEDLGNGSGPQPARTGHVDVDVSPAAGVTIDPATTCHVNGAAPHAADNLSDDGTCVVVFTSADPAVVTGSATATLDYSFDEGDITVVRNTSAQHGDGPDVTKRFVDARVSIEPDDTNEVGEEHTFTVTAEQNDGTGWVPSTGHVDVVLTDTDGADSGTPTGSCTNAGANLDANGECTITFTSPSAGLVTAEATLTVDFTTDQGDIQVVRTTAAQNGPAPDVSKRFVDATVTIAESAVNEVGDFHTWTVTAKQTTDNGGLVPATDGHVDVVLANQGSADFQIDAAGTTCHVNGDAPHDADNLDASGQCTVRFTSDTPGTVTGTATATLNIDTDPVPITVTRTTAGQNGPDPDVSKAFVDARVSIAPDDVNGIGESHTFTVKVEQNTGSGWQPATNGDVSLTLTPSGGAVIEPSANTCNQVGNDLDANGECAVTFTSQSAGTVDGAASVDVTITTPQGDIVVTRTTSAQKGAEPDVTKQFVVGSLRWIKENDQGGLLGGATFEVCFTERFISANGSFEPIADTDPDPNVDSRCFPVVDNTGQQGYTGPDTDDTAGEFQLDDLYLGTYTVQEKVAPDGYVLDDTLVTVHLTTTDPNAVIDTAFVNASRYKVIVITCNTANETLVDSTVDLNPGEPDGQKETIKAGELPDGVSEATLCGLPGATYDNLPRGTYNLDVELPDIEPFFP